MTLPTLLAFNAAALAAVAAPGPAFLLCARTALEAGRPAGAATGLGLAVSAGLWTVAALAGLEALFDAYPATYHLLRLGGAVLIVGFAAFVWRDADAPPPDPAALPSRRHAFGRGLLLNLLNPKTFLFSAGVVLVIFPPALTRTEWAVVGANHALLEAAFYGALAWAMTRDRVRRRYLRWKPALSRVMAVVMALLGLRLLVMG
ncbi:LysE family transporter [Jannaschia sp. Os4]|nr:LysE family transporter [Jannaschia sp. Os4]